MGWIKRGKRIGRIELNEIWNGEEAGGTWQLDEDLVWFHRRFWWNFQFTPKLCGSKSSQQVQQTPCTRKFPEKILIFDNTPKIAVVTKTSKTSSCVNQKPSSVSGTATSPTHFRVILQTIMNDLHNKRKGFFCSKRNAFYVERCKVKDRQLRKVRFGWESSSIFSFCIFMSSSFRHCTKKKFSTEKERKTFLCWQKNTTKCNFYVITAGVESALKQSRKNFEIVLWLFGERRKTFLDFFPPSKRIAKTIKRTRIRLKVVKMCLQSIRPLFPT
jgi:hypothetical protein